MYIGKFSIDFKILGSPALPAVVDQFLRRNSRTAADVLNLFSSIWRQRDPGRRPGENSTRQESHETRRERKCIFIGDVRRPGAKSRCRASNTKRITHEQFQKNNTVFF